MICLDDIIRDISHRGGESYYVGGYVRDKILGKENKDIDVEIFNIEPTELRDILAKYGQVDEIGASFGILKLHGLDVDFAMPRRENKVSDGHGGFDVTVDPYMSLVEASRRRDFTINQLMMNCATGEIIDNFGGIEDIERGIIRHIDDATFIEDELRALRACQFASRFDFDVDGTTRKLCSSFNLKLLPRERIFEEVSKALLKGNAPSVFFEELREMGLLGQIFPQLEKLIDLEQAKEYHPEGDVWTHTMMVINELAMLRGDSNYPLALMLAGLCHDLGKIDTTIVNDDGMVTAHGHEHKIGHARELIGSISNNRDLMTSVELIIENHMRPNSKGIMFEASNSAIRRLIVSCKGKSVNINDVLLMAEADHRGRLFSEEHKDYSKQKEWFLDMIQKNSSSDSNGDIKPLVSGKDLIAIGVTQGKYMGELLKIAFEYQLDGFSKSDIIEKILEIKRRT